MRKKYYNTQVVVAVTEYKLIYAQKTEDDNKAEKITLTLHNIPLALTLYALPFLYRPLYNMTCAEKCYNTQVVVAVAQYLTIIHRSGG